MKPIDFKFKDWRRVRYLIGKGPYFDPCLECLVKVPCRDACDDKLLFEKDIGVIHHKDIYVSKSNVRKGK